MLKSGIIKIVPSCILLAALVLIILAGGTASGQSEVTGEVEEKLTRLSAEEKKVLEELFALSQTIAELEQEERALAADIDALERDAAVLREAIAAEEERFGQNRQALQQVLKSYQRMGPASFLERLLAADSLADFLHRISTLRDLARNTGRLLDLLQESRDRLATQKAELDEKLAALEQTRKNLEESIAKTIAAREELEAYLASLAEEREHYETRLSAMREAWNELIQFFPEVTRSFSRLLKEADLPADTVQIEFTVSGIKASLADENLNGFLAEYELNDLAFAFSAGRVGLTVAPRELAISGVFVLEDNTLKFVAEEGTFFGVPLNTGHLEALFAEEEMYLDLSSILGDSKITAVNVTDHHLELYITPVFK
jgi:peptidoglycan hydrolase CwlO-like protein